MSNAESGRGPSDPNGSGDDATPPVWGDVTAHQPERDVPAPAQTHPVPPVGDGAAPQPGAEVPPPATVPTPPSGEPAGTWNTTPQAPEPPTFGQQLHQPNAGQQPAPGQYGQPAPGQPQAPQAPAGQYQAAPGAPVFVNPDQQAAAAATGPQFVKADGTLTGQGAQAGDVFAQRGQQQPGGPIFVAPGGQPLGGQPGGPAFVQPGAQSGGPVFVQPGVGAQGVPGGPLFVQGPKGPSPVDVERPWAWWLGPLAFLVAIFGIVPAQLGLAGAIAAASGESGSMTEIIDDYTVWFGILQDVCWVGIVLLLPYLVVKHLRPEQLGIRIAPIGRSLAVAAGAVVAFFVFAAIYSAALGLEDTDNTMLQDTGFGDGVAKDVLFALLFTVAAPVAEELLFRGLLFRTLRDGLTKVWGTRGGLAGGAVISGLIFGGVHVGGGQDDFLPVLMLLGIVLALAYHWSGTIYVPIAIHAANNALATGANSDPAADWIYGLIALGPVIALGVTYLIGKLISRLFPPEPKNPAHHPAEQPATL